MIHCHRRGKQHQFRGETVIGAGAESQPILFATTIRQPLRYTAMAMITVNLADELKARAEAQAADAGCDSLDEYLANLIESDVAVPLDPALEAELLAAESRPARNINEIDWEQKERALRERHAR
jgi:hypothetical protein